MTNIKDAIDKSDLPPSLKEEIGNIIDRFSSGISYEFPIVNDPLGALGSLLVGRDATLFKFTLDAKLHAKEELRAPIAFGVDALVSGTINLDAHFEIGYDTFGLRKFIVKGINNNGGFDGDDLLDGLYISQDSHVYLDGGFDVGAAAGEILYEAQVTGGVKGGFHLNMPAESDLKSPDGFSDNDPSKIRPFSELSHCLFEVDGKLLAGLHAKLHIGIGAIGTDFETTIAETTLIDFSNPCVPNPFEYKAPELANLDNSGVLSLYVGTDGWKRTGNLPGQLDEKYVLTVGLPHPNDPVPMPPGDIIDISAFGMTQRFIGVKKIVAHGDLGNDTIQIFASDNPILYPLTAEVELYGDDGIDTLSYEGTGKAILYGGRGDDFLSGGAGDNKLFGEKDNDTIQGGDGPNLINGGDGNDTLTGGSGPNSIGSVFYSGIQLTENGDDKLLPGQGLNIMRGGEGNDTLTAGPLADDLDGGNGDDLLQAGAGSGKFQGNRGSDTITWQVGNGIPAFIDGGSGAGLNTLSLGGSKAEAAPRVVRSTLVSICFRARLRTTSIS